MSQPKKLPVGISTFSEVLNDGYAYVDKTAHVLRLANSGKYYFLSRPRRFGKSLLLSTLAEAFSGNETLFRGLSIHPHWDWSVKCPLIYVSFGAGVLRSGEELEQHILEALRLCQEQLGIHELQSTSSKGQFAELIRRAKEKYGQGTVVLIDEYDKPILDNITAPDVATEMRSGLRNFYSVIKDSDAHMRFAFLTGVSKFAKVSVFSGLNNLKDITLDPAYATICGYTQNELETVFLLNYPNREVRSTFNQVILSRYLMGESPERLPVMRALLANDFEALQQRFTALFAGIANDNYRKNPIAEYEGYYAAVMYAYLCSLVPKKLAMYYVVYTDNDNVLRIISMREANKQEIKFYVSHY